MEYWDISLSLNTVLDYFNGCIYKYRIININRSALSSFLAPIDGHDGLKVVEGSINLRPPIRKLFPTLSVQLGN